MSATYVGAPQTPTREPAGRREIFCRSEKIRVLLASALHHGFTAAQILDPGVLATLTADMNTELPRSGDPSVETLMYVVAALTALASVGINPR